MRAKNVSLALATALLVACSMNDKMRHPLSPTSLGDLNRRIQNTTVTMEVESLHDPDTTYTLEGKASIRDGKTMVFVPRYVSHAPLDIPFENVRKIEYKNRGAGALEGMVVGAALGLATGLVGTHIPSSMHSSDSDGPDPRKASILIELPLLLGTIAGMVIGALAGHDTTITF
jgi:hypothetical protein